MKTTFDIPEPLLREVQSLARLRGTTTKSVLEQALRRLLDEDAAARQFALADASVTGEGLLPEFADARWARLRAAAYGMNE